MTGGIVDEFADGRGSTAGYGLRQDARWIRDRAGSYVLMYEHSVYNDCDFVIRNSVYIVVYIAFSNRGCNFDGLLLALFGKREKREKEREKKKEKKYKI